MQYVKITYIRDWGLYQFIFQLCVECSDWLPCDDITEGGDAVVCAQEGGNVGSQVGRSEAVIQYWVLKVC